MSNLVTVDVQFDDSALQDKLENLLGDDWMMTEIHNVLAKMCDPYVPWLTGNLAQSGMGGVSAAGVHYPGPYAHYQYYGLEFNHTLDYHPKASAMWDKAMMSEVGDSFIKQVEEIVKRRARELYGS